MTVKQVCKEIEKLADKIDDYLGKLEQEGKDNSEKYHNLLYIAGGLRELADSNSD